LDIIIAMPAANDRLDGRSKKRPGLEEQRRNIINAAVDLFIEYGSNAISISQICDYAAVSRPTFYRCFKDRDELIYALYQESVNGYVEQIMLEGLNRREKYDSNWMQQALGQLFDAIFANAKMAELVFVEANDPNSPAQAIIDKAFEQAADVMAAFMKKTTGQQPSRVFLKSIMAAHQWIAHDAIRKGLTYEAILEAKAASWELVRKLI